MRKRVLTTMFILAASLIGTRIGHEPEVQKPEKVVIKVHEHSLGQEDILEAEYQKARTNPALRQNFCNMIYQHRERLGGFSWMSFEGIIYDPGFEKFDKRSPQKKVRAYGKGKGYVLATTDQIYGPELRRVPTWINDHAFRLCQTADEFYSMLDNEASSALFFHERMFHQEYGAYVQKYGISFSRDRDKAGFLELVSFDIQLYNIHTGLRKVSPGFMKIALPGARGLYGHFQQMTKENTRDGMLAKELLKVVDARPTAKYFRNSS